ncbi:MAG: aminotransferase, partial [Bacteroidota bacterium]
MTSRRNFLNKTLVTTGSLLASGFFHTTAGKNFLDQISKYSEEDVTDNEEFWYWIQQAYTVSANIINLNNGGVSPQPRVVQDAVERYNQLSNEMPSFYMWRTLDQGREPLRMKLADLAGCSNEEDRRDTSELQ